MNVPWYLMAKGKGGGGYKTASGPIVSINDALAAPLRSLRVGIDPVQDLHGYDAPWPAGGGVNLFNPALVETGTKGEFTLSIDGNDIVLNGNASSTTYFNLQSGFSFSGSGDYIRFGLKGQSTTSNILLQIQPSDSTVLNISISQTAESYAGLANISDRTYGGYIRISAGASFNNFRINLFAAIYSSGSQTYSPYSNICPISGWSAVNVWVKPTYDPTADPTATIQLGQTVYGGYISVSEDGSAELVADRAKFTFDSNTPIAQVADNRDGNLRVKYTSGIPAYKTRASGICSAFPVITTETAYNYAPANCVFSSNGVYVMPPADVEHTELAYTQWLSSVGEIDVVMELATPLTYPLSDIEVTTLAGTNVIWADCGEVDVEYLSAGGANADLMKLAVAFMGRK